jgi:glycine C-acetyltransferase
LQQLGFNTGKSETPITPVIVGEGALAMRFSKRLFEEGVFAQGIVFPTVPADKCRVRTIVSAIHTKDELSEALGIFERVGKELQII